MAENSASKARSSANSPAGSAFPTPQFWLDLKALSIVSTPELQSDPEAQRLAEIILEELTESNQQQLREWYLAAKLDLIQSTPISHIDYHDGIDAAAENLTLAGLAAAFTVSLVKEV